MNNIILIIAWSVICSLGYAFWTYRIVSTKFPKTRLIENIWKDFVDLSPCFFLFFFFNKPTVIFLFGCMVANKLMDETYILGALGFCLTYVYASVFISINYEFNIIKLFVSLITITAICCILIPYWKESITLKISACLYALITLSACLYTFLICWNVGFLLLVIADILLLISRLNLKNDVEKITIVVSNCFYYFGISFIPLILTNIIE